METIREKKLTFRKEQYIPLHTKVILGVVEKEDGVYLVYSEDLTVKLNIYEVVLCYAGHLRPTKQVYIGTGRFGNKYAHIFV